MAPAFPAVNNWAFRFGNRNAPILTELFVDHSCPFASKLLKTLATEVIPKTDKMQVAVYLYSQPWHWQSAILNLVSLSVCQAYPEQWVKAALAIVDKREALLVPETCNKSFNTIVSDVIDTIIAAGVPVEKDVLLKYTTPGTPENTTVNQEVRFHQRKGRQNSVHATPTVIINGLTEPSIESSFTAQQWFDHIEHLNKQVIPVNRL